MKVTVLVLVFVSAFTVSGVWAADKRISGLPDIQQASNPKLAELGKLLFFDKHLSKDGKVSCATCHIPEKVFSDGLPVAKGIFGQAGTRNTPSLFNVAFNTSEFWDGRRDSLEHQALDPILNSREQGLSGVDELLEIINRDPRMKSLFADFFGHVDPVSADHVADALAAYERELIAADSPFDEYQFGGKKSALNDSQVRGLALFAGRAQCSTCHVINEQHALFTDNGFHRLGIGFAKIEKNLPALTKQIKDADAAAQDKLVLENPDMAELGRFVATRKVEDIGAFKTPSLRNVALTAPYMHDGSVATLEEAIDRELYYRSAESGHPLILSIQERKDLLDFLQALTSDEIKTGSANQRNQ